MQYEQGRRPVSWTHVVVMASVLTVISAADWQWVTVLAVRADAGDGNVYELLMTKGEVNDAPGKESLPLKDIAATHNFRSHLLDHLSVIKPKQVRLVLCDREGYFLWFTTFSSKKGGQDPKDWMKPTSILVSSDRLLKGSSNVSIVFNKTKLDIRLTKQNEERLMLTWDPDPTQFLLPTNQYSASPAVLTLGPVISNKDTVMSQASTASSFFTFRAGHTFWMFLMTSHYLAGIGLRKNDSAPGMLKQFQLAVTLDPQCYPQDSGDELLYTPIYLPGTSTPRVFNVTYNQGTKDSLSLFWFDDVVAASCLRLNVLSSTGGDHYTDIYLYQTENAVLEGRVAAIQWWIDKSSTTAKPKTATLTTSSATKTWSSSTTPVTSAPSPTATPTTSVMTAPSSTSKPSPFTTEYATSQPSTLSMTSAWSSTTSPQTTQQASTWSSTTSPQTTQQASTWSSTTSPQTTQQASTWSSTASTSTAQQASTWSSTASTQSTQQASTWSSTASTQSTQQASTWSSTASTQSTQQASKPQTSTLITTTDSGCKVVIVCHDSSSVDVTSRSSDVTQTSPSVARLNQTQVEKIREEIQETLGVEKRETTRFKRQFMSVPDARRSSMLIGVVGVSCITVVLVGIVLLDLHILIIHLKNVLSSLIQALTPQQQPLQLKTDLNMDPCHTTPHPPSLSDPGSGNPRLWPSSEDHLV